MPPLLPEPLNQPVQIVVQSQPTDWWSIGATVVGTLLGAALGAGLGAWGSYKATVKAGYGQVRRAKIEEALSIISGYKKDDLKLAHETHCLIHSGLLTKASTKARNELCREDVLVSSRLSVLASVYFEHLQDMVDELAKVLFVTRDLLSDIGNKLNEGLAGEYINVLRDFKKSLSKCIERLHSALVAELRKGA